MAMQRFSFTFKISFQQGRRLGFILVDDEIYPKFNPDSYYESSDDWDDDDDDIVIIRGGGGGSTIECAENIPPPVNNKRKRPTTVRISPDSLVFKAAKNLRKHYDEHMATVCKSPLPRGKTPDMKKLDANCARPNIDSSSLIAWGRENNLPPVKFRNNDVPFETMNDQVLKLVLTGAIQKWDVIKKIQYTRQYTPTAFKEKMLTAKQKTKAYRRKRRCRPYSWSDHYKSVQCEHKLSTDVANILRCPQNYPLYITLKRPMITSLPQLAPPDPQQMPLYDDDFVLTPYGAGKIVSTRVERYASLDSNSNGTVFKPTIIYSIDLNFGICHIPAKHVKPISGTYTEKTLILGQEKDKEVPANNEALAKKDQVIVSKDQQIASLKRDLESQQRVLENFIMSKNNEIKSLKAKLENSKTSIDTLDLTTSDEPEHANKRIRIENGPKSSLAILHESSQKVVKIKTEKNAAMASLEKVQEEKQAVQGDLEEVRGDLGDANELVEQQVLATNIWQGRFDELAAMVEAGQVDGAAIAAIRNRSLASGS